MNESGSESESASETEIEVEYAKRNGQLAFLQQPKQKQNWYLAS